jgi:hypothetical protein
MSACGAPHSPCPCRHWQHSAARSLASQAAALLKAGERCMTHTGSPKARPSGFDHDGTHAGSSAALQEAGRGTVRGHCHCRPALGSCGQGATQARWPSLLLLPNLLLFSCFKRKSLLEDGTTTVVSIREGVTQGRNFGTLLFNLGYAMLILRPLQGEFKGEPVGAICIHDDSAHLGDPNLVCLDTGGPGTLACPGARGPQTWTSESGTG